MTNQPPYNTADGRVFHWGNPYTTHRREWKAIKEPTQVKLDVKAVACGAGVFLSIPVDGTISLIVKFLDIYTNYYHFKSSWWKHVEMGSPVTI